MSLLDALLLDAARFNVWIAARTDGVGGSGVLPAPYTFQQIVIKRNMIRQVVGIPDDIARGIEINSAKNVLLENNTIELIGSKKIVCNQCESVRGFANQLAGGLFIPVAPDLNPNLTNIQSPKPDLETLIQDALIMAF